MDEEDWLERTIEIFNEPLATRGTPVIQGLGFSIPSLGDRIESSRDLDDLHGDIYRASSTVLLTVISQLRALGAPDSMQISEALDGLLRVDSAEPGINWPTSPCDKLLWLFELQNNEVDEIVSVAGKRSDRANRCFAEIGPLASHWFRSRALLPLDLQEVLYEAWQSGIASIYKEFWATS